MSERVLLLTATIPADTSEAAPVTIPLTLDNWTVDRVDLEVPPGPAGCMGFYLANNGQPVIPRTPGAWIVWDNQSETFYPTGYPNASGWEIVGYNTGTYPHTVTVRFHVTPPDQPSPDYAPVAPTFIATGLAAPTEHVL